MNLNEYYGQFRFVSGPFEVLAFKKRIIFSSQFSKPKKQNEKGVKLETKKLKKN